jgi:uncharacterized membrane protein
MENNCDIQSSFVLSVIIASLMSLLLLFFTVADITILDLMILSVFNGIISSFASIILVNRYIYKMKNNYDILPEFIISVIVAYLLFFIILLFIYPLVDPEIQLNIESCSYFIGIISVFASIFIKDKLFKKNKLTFMNLRKVIKR